MFEPGVFLMKKKSVYDDKMSGEEESLDFCGVIHESEIAGACRSTCFAQLLPCTPIFFSL